jgi:hypothetical protein
MISCVPSWGTEGEFAEAKKELLTRYRSAAPLWKQSAFKGLPEIWSKQGEKGNALASITVGSPEYWQEMRLRYGVHPPREEDINFELETEESKEENQTAADEGVPFGINWTDKELMIPPRLLQTHQGTQVNCRICHSTVLFAKENGKFVPKFAEGIPNVFFDFERLHQELAKAGDTPRGHLFKRNPPRGFINSADFFGVLVPFLRPDFPKPSLFRYMDVFLSNRPTKSTDEIAWQVPLLPYIKTQPWINYGTKLSGTETYTRKERPDLKSEEIPGSGLYVDGGFFGNNADVTYATTIAVKRDGSDYLEARENFRNTVPPYFKSLKAPRYPFLDEVSVEKALRGKVIYDQTCAECHGSYHHVGNKDFDLEHYPGRIVDIDTIGTDPLRLLYPYKSADVEKLKILQGASPDASGKYLKGYLAKTYGYKAPPLTAIWARAPYLHNASVVNLTQLLLSPIRSRKFAIIADSTNPTNYDKENVGWQYTDWSGLNRENIVELVRLNPALRVYDPEYKTDEETARLVASLERIKKEGIDVDPTKPENYSGMRNTGHQFGDHLTVEERSNLIEFLKTL